MRKSEESKDMDSNSKSYTGRLIKAYTIDNLKSIKDCLKSLETETVRVDLDDLFKINRIKEDSEQASLILGNPSVLEITRMAAYIYNQKAMVAITKEKNKLALQNLVKAIASSSKLVLSTGDILTQFILLVNTAFVLNKLDKTSDAISFCNQGLLLGEEALNKLTSGKPKAAKECMEAFRTFTFTAFFIRGGDNFGSKKKDPDEEHVLLC